MTPTELPYFRFFHNDWMGGLISRQKREVQGFFIDLCAIYWKQQCKGDIKKLKQYISDFDTYIETCIDLGIVEKKNKTITIKFLKRQREELIKKSSVNSANGCKGGRPKGLGKSERKAKGKRAKSETKAFSDSESDSNTDIKEDCKTIIDYYLKLKPRKFDTSMTRGKDHILKHLKEYSVIDLLNSVKNYEKDLKLNGNYGTAYALNIGNFFGRDLIFKTYLSENIPPIEDDPRNETLAPHEIAPDPYDDPFATGEL